MKVISGFRTQVKNLTRYWITRVTYTGRELGNEVERSGKAEIRETDFLAAGEAYKDVIWATPGFKERIFDRSGLSARGGLPFCARTLPLWFVSVTPSLKLSLKPLLHTQLARRAVCHCFNRGSNFFLNPTLSPFFFLSFFLSLKQSWLLASWKKYQNTQKIQMNTFFIAKQRAKFRGRPLFQATEGYCILTNNKTTYFAADRIKSYKVTCFFFFVSFFFFLVSVL